MYRKSKGYWNYWQYVIFGRLRKKKAVSGRGAKRGASINLKLKVDRPMAG